MKNIYLILALLGLSNCASPYKTNHVYQDQGYYQNPWATALQQTGQAFSNYGAASVPAKATMCTTTYSYGSAYTRCQ